MPVTKTFITFANDDVALNVDFLNKTVDVFDTDLEFNGLEGLVEVLQEIIRHIPQEDLQKPTDY